MNSWTQWLGTTALVATLSAVVVPSTVFAQNQDEEEEAIEEVLVTGSRIKRDSTFSTPQPVEIIDRAAIDKMGVPTITDIVKNLTINTGSNFNNDISPSLSAAITSYLTFIPKLLVIYVLFATVLISVLTCRPVLKSHPTCVSLISSVTWSHVKQK